jgi:hypothetical protein
MKSSLIILMSIVSSVSFGSSNSIQDNWIVTTQAQKRILKRDPCGQAALNAAASLVSKEIQEAGVDYPDHIYLSDLHVSSPGRYYAITFKGDTTLLVQTRRYGTGCKAIKPSRFEGEPRLSGGN